MTAALLVRPRRRGNAARLRSPSQALMSAFRRRWQRPRRSRSFLRQPPIRSLRVSSQASLVLGNVTGITFVSVELIAKRLELLHELLPGAIRIAVLVNPNNPGLTQNVIE